MHRLFIRFSFSLIGMGLCVVIIGNCQDVQLQSEVRITKATNCNTTGLKWNLQNVSISYFYPGSYLNVVLNVTEETKKIKRLFVHLDRCNDQGFDCEDFQNWYLDNFCSMLKWRNQIWSGWADSLRPPFRCPIKKIIYEGRNITFDFNAVTRWYPDCVKYRWRINVKVSNERDELVLCVDFHTHVYQYRKKNKYLPSNY